MRKPKERWPCRDLELFFGKFFTKILNTHHQASAIFFKPQPVLLIIGEMF